MRIDTKYIEKRPSSSLKEDSIKRAVILEEESKALWDSNDRMAMLDVFDNFSVNVFGKRHRSLRSTGGSYSSAFAGERDKERVLTSVAVYPSGTVSEDAAV